MSWQETILATLVRIGQISEDHAVSFSNGEMAAEIARDIELLESGKSEIEPLYWFCSCGCGRINLPKGEKA